MMMAAMTTMTMMRFFQSVGLWSAFSWTLLFSTSDASTCYWPDGTPSDYGLVCGSDTTYICCNSEDSTCANDLKLCNDAGEYYIGACSNSSWPQADCPNYCQKANGLVDTFQWVYPCTGDIYCCGDSDSCCQGQTFTIAAGAVATTTLPPPPATYTVEPTAVASSGGGGLSTGQLVASILTPIVALLVAVLSFTKWYLGHRKKNASTKKKKSPSGKSEKTPSTNPVENAGTGGDKTGSAVIDEEVATPPKKGGIFGSKSQADDVA